MIHNALKTYFDVTTVADLNTSESEVYFNGIRILMNVEFGMLLPKPKEPSCDELLVMDMENFLKL